MCGKKNPPKFESCVNGRLSEQQLLVKIIYRKGGTKRSKSVVGLKRGGTGQGFNERILRKKCKEVFRPWFEVKGF